jgi:hypothetical protein
MRGHIPRLLAALAPLAAAAAQSPVPDVALLEFLGNGQSGHEWAEFFDSLPEGVDGDVPEPPPGPEGDDA